MAAESTGQNAPSDLTERHHPTVLAGGRRVWVTCSCGWQTPDRTRHYSAQSASYEWAVHLAYPTTVPR